MTKEEAAEIILRGDGVEWCEGCDGTGYMTLEQDVPHTKFGEFQVVPCRQCFGKMVFIKENYREACRMLDKPLPHEKPSLKIRGL